MMYIAINEHGDWHEFDAVSDEAAQTWADRHLDSENRWELDRVDEVEEVEGVPFNPILSDEFDNTPNEDRPDMETAYWWDRPFVRVEFFREESYAAYCERLQGYGYEPDKTEEEWDQFRSEMREGWFKAFPHGVRYDVRCLDGGAWDRSTGWGFFGTIREALDCVREGPKWRQSMELRYAPGID